MKYITIPILAILLQTANAQEQDQKSCQGTYEIHESIRAFESVFGKPSLANTQIKKEYEKLKKEYQPPDQSGVFLEIDESISGEKSEVLEDNLREVLSDHKCRVEQTKCKTYGGYTLRVKTKDRVEKRGLVYWCYANAKIELLDSKNDIARQANPEPKIPGTEENKGRACEVSFKRLAPEIFDKIKTNISEVCK